MMRIRIRTQQCLYKTLLYTVACLVLQGRSWVRPPAAVAFGPTVGCQTLPANRSYNLTEQATVLNVVFGKTFFSTSTHYRTVFCAGIVLCNDIVIVFSCDYCRGTRNFTLPVKMCDLKEKTYILWTVPININNYTDSYNYKIKYNIQPRTLFTVHYSMFGLQDFLTNFQIL